MSRRVAPVRLVDGYRMTIPAVLLLSGNEDVLWFRFFFFPPSLFFFGKLPRLMMFIQPDSASTHYIKKFFTVPAGTKTHPIALFAQFP